MAEALEIAGLGTAINRRVRTYSQGMRQRLAIAQAMLGLPDLLLMDEPTNGLDPPQIHAMREVLRRYAATGRTVLVSSHLLSEVEQTCSHVVVVHLGKTIASGTVDELVAASGEMVFGVDDVPAAVAVLRDLAGDIEITEAGVQADLGDRPAAEVVAALVGAGVAVNSAAPRNRLEDVFLALIGASGASSNGVDSLADMSDGVSDGRQVRRWPAIRRQAERMAALLMGATVAARPPATAGPGAGIRRCQATARQP